MEKKENSDIRDRGAQQLCTVIREEQAEELARAGMGNNAARKRYAIAALNGQQCCLRSSDTMVEQ